MYPGPVNGGACLSRRSTSGADGRALLGLTLLDHRVRDIDGVDALDALNQMACQEAAQTLVGDASGAGTVPCAPAELLQLPGVSLYMARSIRANAFGQPTAVLDTNVARILQRFVGPRSQTARPREDTGPWEAAIARPGCFFGSVYRMGEVDMGRLLSGRGGRRAVSCLGRIHL